MGECIFCKIAKGEINSEKIAETNNFFAIKDINPVSEGHSLIIPKKHFVTLLDIPNTLGKELLDIFTNEELSNLYPKDKILHKIFHKILYKM